MLPSLVETSYKLELIRCEKLFRIFYLPVEAKLCFVLVVVLFSKFVSVKKRDPRVLV